MNKRGFMMAELVVVSSIVMVTLAALYISYSQLFTKYYTRIDYYDPDTLYELAYCRDVLIDSEKLNGLLTTTTSSKNLKADLTEAGYEIPDEIYLVHNNKNNISSTVITGNIHNTFKDYLEYLQNSVDLTKSNYVMIMERCITEDDCKYGYLEVYDGLE